jgi:hypothetical protein
VNLHNCEARSAVAIQTSLVDPLDRRAALAMTVLWAGRLRLGSAARIVTPRHAGLAFIARRRAPWRSRLRLVDPLDRRAALAMTALDDQPLRQAGREACRGVARPAPCCAANPVLTL